MKTLASLARTLNVSDKTVQAWKQGVKPLSGSALWLLQITESYPETLLTMAAE